LTKFQSEKSILEAKNIQISVENTKTESLLLLKQQELIQNQQKIAAYKEITIIQEEEKKFSEKLFS
jgi:hypothetical protein